MEIATNGLVLKPVLRLEMAPLGCHGNLVTLSWPALAPSSSAEAGFGDPRPALQPRAEGEAGLYQVKEGGIYPHTSGNREVRGLGGGTGWTKGRGEGVLGITKGLRMGQLEGGGGGSPAGDKWGTQPGWAPDMYNTVCYKIQNLPAGAAEFLCLSKASGELG